MKAVEQIEIDGVQYVVIQYGAVQSLKILARITKLVEAPIEVLIDSGGEEANIDNLVIAKMLSAIAKNLDEDDMIRTIELIFKDVKSGGNNIIFDVHFQGRLDHMFRVLGAILKAQYGNFLEKAVGLVSTKIGQEQAAETFKAKKHSSAKAS